VHKLSRDAENKEEIRRGVRDNYLAGRARKSYRHEPTFKNRNCYPEGSLLFQVHTIKQEIISGQLIWWSKLISVKFN